MKKAFRYGVELETVCPRGNYDVVKDKIKGINCIAKSDGSIHTDSDDSGMEIVTRPMGFNKLARLLTQIDRLTDENDIKVNASCGLHVHTSNKRFFIAKNLTRIIKTWIAIEDVLLAMQPQSRLNNEYCQRRLRSFVTTGAMPKFATKKSELIRQCSLMDRYYTLNLNALAKHGTLEVRIHSGSTNAKKITYFIKLLTAIFNYALTAYNQKEVDSLFNMATSEAKIEKVFLMLKLEAKVITHFTARIQKFLIPLLARQQNSAKELMKIAPNKRKLQNQYNKISEELTEARNTETRLLRSFTSNY